MTPAVSLRAGGAWTRFVRGKTPRAVLTTCLGMAVAASCSPAARGPDDARLRAADSDTANWLSYGRTYAEQRHSPLTQVNDSTVARLGLAWTLDMGTLHGLEATPLVDDGTMFVTSAWSVVYALDARTGEVRWRHDPAVPKGHAKFVCCGVVNRGVALYRDKVYVGTIDGRLIALDRETGEPRWSVETTPRGSPYSITGAPRIANGRVVIGNGGSEYAVRGYVSAYDAESGSLAWRTFMVPGDPSQPFESEALRRAAATWSGDWWKGGGGASPWDPIVYDPALDLVYVGTANPSPWYPALRGTTPGDNLYSSSIVALHAGTGEVAWHYQTTPSDAWDFDATQPILLADLTIEGRARRVLMQANKNAFFYVIDRETGALISATPYAPMSWATGVDSMGRPMVVPSAIPTSEGALVTPANFGAHNWNPISFNPATGLVYLAVTDSGTDLHVVDPAYAGRTTDRTIGFDPRYEGPLRARVAAIRVRGRLVAWDPVARREGWRVEHPVVRSGGTLSTAGGLVFQGRVDGAFIAYRATDGARLWEVNAGVGIAAAPMTYAIGGTQYVAVLAGLPVLYADERARAGPGRLLVFALDGSAAIPLTDTTTRPIAPPTFQLAATTADVDEGRALFRLYCLRCHGTGLNLVKSGAVPDLRRSTNEVHATFAAIVRGGARQQLGMPSFAEDLTDAQVRQIQAYVLSEARSASTRR